MTQAEQSTPAPASLRSFRDPFGFVIRENGCVHRCITAAGLPAFDAVRRTGFLDRLVAEGRLVPFAEAEGGPGGSSGPHGHAVTSVLTHPPLPFISYPYEWCFSALKQAALFHLDLLLDAIPQGVTLRDASAFNVQFTVSGPIFIDHLSFAPYTEGAYWLGHDQFCRQFLNPLLLEARAGVAPDAWYRGSPEGLSGNAVYRLLPWSSRLTPAIFLNVALPETLSRRGNGDGAARVRAQRPLRTPTLLAMLQQLKRLVLQLDIPRQTTVWSGYTDTRSYADAALTAKMEFVRASVAQARPAMAWDLGCNTGEFAELALRAGAGFVVGFDSDRTAVELAYARARGRNLSFLPLHADLLNPTPALGWRGSERASLMERANADFTLALALVHHLVFHGNVPLEEVVDWVIALAPTGVIEFVPKSDPMVQRLLSLRDDLFPSYSEEVFRSAIRKRAEIAAEMRVPDSARLLVRYARA